jgi:hypothetical protein
VLSRCDKARQQTAQGVKGVQVWRRGRRCCGGRLQARLVAEGLAVLDAVAEPGDPGRFRAFFAAGTDRSAAGAAARSGPFARRRWNCARCRAASCMMRAGRGRLALADGAVDVAPRRRNAAVLAGAQCAAGVPHRRTGRNGRRLADPGMRRTTARMPRWWSTARRPKPITPLCRKLLGSGAGCALRCAWWWWSPTSPLGKPGLGPETHPFLAPDAPGKDRMTPPDPDPWRAPLGEGLVLEVLKWRYLGEARAVLLLDPCDILPPRPMPAAPSAFDLCVSRGKAWCFWSGTASIPGGCAPANLRALATISAASSTPGAAWRAGVWPRQGRAGQHLARIAGVLCQARPRRDRAVLARHGGAGAGRGLRRNWRPRHR